MRNASHNAVSSHHGGQPSVEVACGCTHAFDGGSALTGRGSFPGFQILPDGIRILGQKNDVPAIRKGSSQ
jgi:hypothetical protein